MVLLADLEEGVVARRDVLHHRHARRTWRAVRIFRRPAQVNFVVRGVDICTDIRVVVGENGDGHNFNFVVVDAVPVVVRGVPLYC